MDVLIEFSLNFINTFPQSEPLKMEWMAPDGSEHVIFRADLEQNSCEKKESKKQRRKGKIYPFECRVPKNSKER